MRRFFVGVVLGAFIGSATTAVAAQIVGSTGYLMGWTVEIDGEEVCEDPYVWTATKEIDCD
jgi:hypothetical protein